jgi:hypothetical protein
MSSLHFVVSIGGGDQLNDRFVSRSVKICVKIKNGQAQKEKFVNLRIVNSSGTI